MNNLAIPKEQLKFYLDSLGIEDPRIKKAFVKVPRHEFVLEKDLKRSYEDIALPIGEEQTISQPSLVAKMTKLLDLKGTERVLEIGTGSGFQAAILAKLAKEVYTIERIPSLAERAEEKLIELGFKNIKVFISNGTLGLPKEAPFDAIIVTASSPKIPQPLIDQLKDGGRIVIPIGESFEDERLVLGIKKDQNLEVKEVEEVAFVPLIGEYGWKK